MSTAGTNLYGSHPVYFDHRQSGTHGVFLLNSNGMDININRTEINEQYLQFNVLGGIIDLYVVAGPTPIETAKQYTAIVGKPLSVPYWALGFHNCRYVSFLYYLCPYHATVYDTDWCCF